MPLTIIIKHSILDAAAALDPPLLLGTLGESLLGNILVGKGAIVKRQGRGMNRAGEGTIRAGYGNKKGQGIVRAGHGNKIDF